MSSALPEHAHYDVTLDSLTIPENWMIGPRSFLVDRIVPDLERILLPSVSTGGGPLSLDVGEHLFSPPAPGGRKNFLQRATKDPEMVLDKAIFVVDLRAYSPGNWAHFLTNHLALLAAICRTTERHWRDFTALLPAQTPGYIRKLAELVELPCIYTDQPVRARGVHAEFERITVLRGERPTLLNRPDLCPVAELMQSGKLPVEETPKRIFIGRKDARKLRNQAEVMAFLETRGFVCLYAEELGVPGQLRTLSQAEQIVAVHGAALAPIIYRAPSLPPLKLVELFPVGHVTNYYRAFSAAMQAPWCGVRAHIEPANLREIYKLDQGAYTKHSLDDFTVDVASVEAALDVVA